ncbi:hypothetical protein [Pseudogemmobacter faecipullorum]|uniref:ATP-binding protein n=1 Tax=Pseudogemmobacter faecipullorum TaxID=2755041 RepID=A0ABS8CS34_9RHOB|nr:hypothetical protein [Pseudogemmobacter faecipullorum]MCB5412178.1 hypothetical protein [Pseudogemmobacter faecipullorum]
MKRISKTLLRHADKLCRQRWRAKLRRAAEMKAGLPPSGGKLRTIIIEAPSVCDFADNYDATVSFLIRLKRAALAEGRRERRRRVTVDMARIEHISIDAALVLAAEFDRWQVMKGVKLRPLTHSWAAGVRNTLCQLGLFELLRMTPFLEAEPDVFDDVTVLKLVSCDTADGRTVAAISEHLQWVAKALGQSPYIYEAMFEAAYNSVLHAYPDTYAFKYPPIRRRWWATARWSVPENELRFLVYDQGVGIAETLPRWKNWEHIVTFLSRIAPAASPLFKEHATMISAALEVSRTSRSGGHGQGLSDIVAPIEELQAGELRILSGKGEVMYYPDGRTVLTEHDQHIGGTLVEWKLPVSLT